jgi:3-hydroxyisobutyrate dehydrogenase-like beta-hydroxyacid dehydrogenase
MGTPMAERLLKAGHDVTIWNRTRAKAEPLAAKGGKIVDKLSDLAGCDVVFSIVSTGPDLEAIYFGKDGLLSGGNGKLPGICVDCSSISVEESAAIRLGLEEHGVDFVAAPVSGNAKVIKAGKLSAVVSGPEVVAKKVLPLIEVFAPQGVSYVGDGELARICKIAHNIMLAVVIENLIEITLLANKMGVPRHAFLAFMNNGVMGSLIKPSMELGGNAPFIVFDDADVDAAIDGAMIAKMRNMGEACTAANRFYVHEKVHDEFAKKLTGKMQALKMGNGLDDGINLGPLVNKEGRDKVIELVDDAVAKGASVFLSSNRCRASKAATITSTPKLNFIFRTCLRIALDQQGKAQIDRQKTKRSRFQDCSQRG